VFPSDRNPVWDAEGRIACPGRIETQIQLVKSLIIDRCTPQGRARLNPATGYRC
jgi:hypothetical protein